MFAYRLFFQYQFLKKKKIFQEYHQAQEAQPFIWPDLGWNCLQWISAGGNSEQNGMLKNQELF